MKRLYNTVMVLAGIAIVMSSCKREESYKPATQEEGSQVYFSKELPTSYNLKDYDTNYFTFEICRVDATQDLTVSLNLTGADSVFSIPASVKFDAGKTVQSVAVTWDTTTVEEGIKYALSIKIKNDTTAYAKSQYDFTAEWPASWTLWGRGHLYEVSWEEDYDTLSLYYQETEYENIWYCKIKNAWWRLDEAGNPVEPVGDYYFYWNTKTDSLYIPDQKIGLSYEYGDLYVSTAAEFYNQYYGWGVVIPSQEYFDWAINWNKKNGLNNGYYDKKGGFYLGDWMYFINGGTVVTDFGVQFGGDQDYFIAEGFVRTTDYNDSKHYGSSLPLFTGTDSSYFFSKDGGKNPELISTFLRYTEDTVTANTTTTYYLGEYFGENKCLAFTAPKSLEDGSPITNVENDQSTGLYAFGEEIWVAVKGGSVSFPEEEGFPTFNITLRVYTKDASGSKLHDFGTVNETFFADGILRDNYTIEDINGDYFNNYLGLWTFTSTDVYYGTGDYQASIIDGGFDESGNPIAKICGLAGYSCNFDTLIAVYDTTYGILSLCAQTLPYLVDGDSVKVYLFDPADPASVYSGVDMYGGMCKDGALAFVNIYESFNFCGLAYTAGNEILFEVYNIYGFSAESVPSGFSNMRRKDYMTLPSIKSVPMVQSGLRMEKVPDKISSSRTFTLTPIVRTSRRSMQKFSPADLIVR